MKKFAVKPLFGMLLGALVATAAVAATSSGFPQKDIRIVVPFSAGGGTDTMARILSTAAGKKYFDGRSLIVENMGGGGGVIGQTYAAKTAEPDGYTVMLYTSSCINNSLLKNVKYSYEDFKPIIGCNPDAELLAVPVDSPYHNLNELLEAAKTQTIKVATPGHSSGHHVRALNMARLMNLKFAYIHSNSAAMQMAQLMGGHCDVSYMTVSEAASVIRSGKVRGIGVMAAEREKSISDVPTFLEQGYKGWIDGANRGIACRKDVPDDIYQYLVEEFRKVASSQECVDMMDKAGMVSGVQSPAEYQAYINFTADGIKALKPVLTKKQ